MFSQNKVTVLVCLAAIGYHAIQVYYADPCLGNRTVIVNNLSYKIAVLGQFGRQIGISRIDVFKFNHVGLHFCVGKQDRCHSQHGNKEQKPQEATAVGLVFVQHNNSLFNVQVKRTGQRIGLCAYSPHY